MTIKVAINKKVFPIAFVISLTITTILFYAVGSTNYRELALEGMVQYILFGIPMVISFLYSIILLVNYSRALFDKRAALLISDSEIEDNLTVFSCGRISWNEIVDIKTSSRFKIRVLLIMVKDPKSVIMRQAFWKRWDLHKYNKKWGTPVIISERAIDYGFFELERILKRKII